MSQYAVQQPGAPGPPGAIFGIQPHVRLNLPGYIQNKYGESLKNKPDPTGYCRGICNVRRRKRAIR